LVDNGTGTTEFQLGTKSGSRGISGCVVSTESTAQTPKWSFDAKTDTDVDHCKLYGCTFLDSSTFDLPLSATYVETLSCTFEGCGVVTPQTSKMEYCNFISADTYAIALSSTTLNIKYCNFINPTNSAIQITTTGTYQFYDMVFTGTSASGPYDIENTTAGLVTIQNNGTSNAQYSNETGGGTTEFQSTKTISVHIEDQNGNNIQGAQVYVQKSSPTTYTSVATGNNQGDGDFVVQESLDADCPATGWLKVFDKSTGKQHNYRYASKSSSTKTFTFPTNVTGTDDGNGTSTTISETGIGSKNIVEGDTIRNTTDGSWAIVLKVEANQVTTTKLSDGGSWASDNYSVHTLAVTYDDNDTVQTPLMNKETDANGDASETFNYQSDTPIIVRIRKSSSGDTRYNPYNTTGTITTSGYFLTAVLIQDSIVS